MNSAATRLRRDGWAALIALALVVLAYGVPTLRAAQLANNECEKQFHKRPFSPWTYPLSFHNGRLQWGRLDPAGIGGYSAEVSFQPPGFDSKVQIYFSSDEFR